MSNCLFFVITKLWREGGYLVARKSHHGWWPHFYWSSDLVTFLEFIPDAKHKSGLFFPPPIFHGHVAATNFCDDHVWYFYRRVKA
jgi:hypothetical protein